MTQKEYNLDPKDNIQGEDFKTYINMNDRDIDAWDFVYDKEYKQPEVRPKLCIFCNEPWTPRMETIYIESGYCESCFSSEACHVVVCDNCNRIVYRK